MSHVGSALLARVADKAGLTRALSVALSEPGLRAGRPGRGWRSGRVVRSGRVDLDREEMDREIARMLSEMAAGEQRPVEELRAELLAEMESES